MRARRRAQRWGRIAGGKKRFDGKAGPRLRPGQTDGGRPRAGSEAGAGRSPALASPAPSRPSASLGAATGLLAPLIPGLAATLLWATLPTRATAASSQALAASFLGLLALPTVLLTGFPLFGGAWRVLLAAATSGLLWLVLGRWAARRAASARASGWRGYAAELAPMVLGVWVGVAAGLGAMVVILTR